MATSPNSGSESTSKSKIPTTDNALEEAMPSFTKHFISNVRRIDDFRRKSSFVDMKLRGLSADKDSEEAGPRILVHKFVLVLNSPYFEKVLKKGKYSHNVPIPTPVLEDLVTYIYTGKMPLLTEENVVETLKACQLLELTEAIQKCHDFLTNLFASQNFSADFLLNNCPSALAAPVIQSLFDNFETYTKTDKFHQLTFEQVEKLVNLRQTIPSKTIQPDTVLKGILNWVLADVKERQKHFLPLMQNISLREISADLMKECVISLNSSYQTHSHSSLSSKINISTNHILHGPSLPENKTGLGKSQLLNENNPRELFAFAEKTTSEKMLNLKLKDPKTDKVSAKQILERSTPMVKFDSGKMKHAEDEVQTPMQLSHVNPFSTLPSPIDKEEPDSTPRRIPLTQFKITPVIRLEKLDLAKTPGSKKRESLLDETIPISERCQAKKIRLDMTGGTTEASVKNSINGNSKQLSSFKIKEELRNSSYADPTVNFEVGAVAEGISSCHPLMFYLCEDPKNAFSIRAYDFRARKSAIVIENALVDRYNYGMALKGQSLLLIGGRNDSEDFLGSKGQECLSTIINFEKFPQICNDKIKRVRYYKDSAPNYTASCLKQPRSNFGTAIRGNRLFAIGGHAMTYTPLRSLKSVEMYESDLEGWKFVAPMLEHREHFGLAWLNSSIYVAGGFKASTFPTALNSVEEYVPETNTWKAAAPLCTKSIATRLVSADKNLYALEGGTQNSCERRNNYEMLDIRAGKWMAPKPKDGGAIRFYRRGAAAACINGNIYSIGGCTARSGEAPIVELLDPRNGEWSMEGELPKGGVFTSVSFMNLQ